MYGVQPSHECGPCGCIKGLNVMAVENDPIVSQSINIGSEDLVRTVETGVVPALKLNVF